MSLEEAYHTLGASPSDPIEIINAKFRNIISKVHPDNNVNGDDEKTIRIIEAHRLIKASVKNNGNPTADDQAEQDFIEGLCKELGKSRFQLKISWESWNDRQTCDQNRLTFKNWLYREIRISDLCQKLNRSKAELVEEYNNKRGNGLVHHGFEDELLMQVRIKELCNKIGKSESELIRDYNNYLTPYVPFLNFEEWLLMRLRIGNIVSQLGGNEEELMQRYRAEGATNISVSTMNFEEWLLMRLRIKNIVSQLGGNEEELMRKYRSESATNASVGIMSFEGWLNYLLNSKNIQGETKKR